MTKRQFTKLAIIILTIIISIFLIYILININELTGLIVIIVMSVLLLLLMVYNLFCDYTMNYPLNSRSEFAFDPQKDNYGLNDDNNYLIVFFEKEPGIWEFEEDNRVLKFDLRKYLFPKLYICSYFIRNIHYVVINKNKYPLPKLMKSLNTYPFNKYQNLDLCFRYKDKEKTIRIVDNYKSKVSFIISAIIESRYGILGLGGRPHSNRLYKYEKISEDIYESERIRQRTSIKSIIKKNKFKRKK